MEKIIRITCQGAAYVPYHQIVPFQGNLKDLSKENYGKLKNSILKLGFSEPCSVWNDDGVYRALNCHQRIRVVTQMVEKEGYECSPLPVNWIECKDEEEAKRKVLALTSAYGEITKDGLREFMFHAQLEFAEVNSDFHFPEIDMPSFEIEFFKDPEVLPPGAGEEDAIPEVKESLVKLGDIWILGNHRLMCGDSTNIENVETLMDNHQAEMMFTDPPYNVGYEGNNFSSGKIKTGKPDWEGGIKNDDMSRDQFTDFLRQVYSNADLILNPGSSIYICYPPGRDGWSFTRVWEDVEWHFQTTLIWLKSHLLISRWDYHPIYEPILYGWKQGAAHSFYGERNQSCVLEHKSALRQNEAGFHPTQKPVSLMEQAILNSSKTHQLLFEPFGGSGSTLIACEKTNRRCFTMELDPHYCGIIIERWEKYSGKKAERLNV